MKTKATRKKIAKKKIRCKKIHYLAALVGWAQHDNAAEVCGTVCHEVGPDQDTPQRMGDKVEAAGSLHVASLQLFQQHFNEGLDFFLAGGIGNVENSITGPCKASFQEGHGLWDKCAGAGLLP